MNDKRVPHVKDKRVYLKKDVRRDQILAAAIAMSLDLGFHNLTRDGVADRANVATGQINHMFSTMNQLRRAVMRAAVHRELLSIIASGLALDNEQALKAPDWLQEKALLSKKSKV